MVMGSPRSTTAMPRCRRRWLHGDGAHAVLAQMLLHFGDDVDLLALDLGLICSAL